MHRLFCQSSSPTRQLANSPTRQDCCNVTWRPQGYATTMMTMVRREAARTYHSSGVPLWSPSHHSSGVPLWSIPLK
ncbi:MAG TPA: hypothetical protein VNG51_17255 [Ktedonobacteraceae bacterium]|nr:hypothetical protein [Ktedonobacteraceae bacterium]